MTLSPGRFSIEGLTIVITGGEGVLGSTLAEAFSEAGARVVLLGINEARGAEISAKINSAGGESIFVSADVLNRESLEEASVTIAKEFGQIDVLINAAGGNKAGATIGPDQTIFDLNIDDFRAVSELNLDGTVLPTIVFGKEIAGKCNW